MASSHNAGSKPDPSPTPDASSSSTASPKPKDAPSPSSPTKWQTILGLIFYTPKRCRYDPANPPRFSIWLNLLFAFAGAFTVANLYYNHPILHLLAQEFGVSNERASLIPTLAQAGYASGLLFLCPLGDVFPRRLYVLSLVLFTSTVWLGLCLTNSFAVFCSLTLITSVTTVTPQLMLPLVGDLAPPHRRASALSLTSSGLLLGLLFARLLSGVVTEYTSWRNIYWLAFGLQYLIFALLWLFMPDYPSTNPDGINYFRILYTILQIFVTHPLLVQACLVGFCTSMTFTSFWTTLTFLLSAPPYEYSTLIIGLFALIGIASMFLGPLWSRLVTDRFIPLFSVIIGLIICMVGTCIGTYTGTFTVAGPIIQAAFLDFGIQTAVIANRSAIYGILPLARNRVNTAYMISAFCGQLTGTAVGNHNFARGGWISSGSTSVGFLAAALLLCVARGPREKRWVGWGGGWQIRKDGDVAKKGDEEKGSAAGEEKDSAESSQHVDEKKERETGDDAAIDLTKVEKGRDAATGSR
ncbi:MAG: hypothetical protein L6R42_006455 [Xanthoria sp. 1 TBL-2021]|nr:MAG: hypothetical protein L6R42_006455 [Xanthoria sp. 1 TBL-2021]